MGSLGGFTIVFAGPHKGLIKGTLDDLKKQIKDAGGEYSSRVSDATHLIASEKQYQAAGVKVSTAMNDSDVKIVTFDWLKDSLESKSPINETSYHPAPSSVRASPAPSAAPSAAPSTTSTQTGKRTRGAAKDDTADTAPSSGRRPAKKVKEDDSQKTQDDVAKDAKDDEPKKAKAKAKDGKKVKAEDSKKAESAPAPPKVLRIPGDLHFPGGIGWIVHIDADGTIYDAMLNQTNASANNNKFYIDQLLVNHTTKKFSTFTRWGRVGEVGQSKVLGDGSFEDAKSAFEKKFHEKSGLRWSDRNAEPKSKKYTFLQKSYEDDDEDGDDSADTKANGDSKEIKQEEPAESKLSEPIQRLMNLIFDTQNFAAAMAAMNYDTNKLPLGKLSKKTLSDGYTVLKELAELIRDPVIASTNGKSFAQATEDLSNRYLSLIPHVIPRGSRPPIINNEGMVKREVEMLESLTDMRLADEIMKDAKGAKDDENLALMDRQFRGLNMKEMTALKPSSNEFLNIQEYLFKTSGATHNIRYTVEDIFRIERVGEFDRFEDSDFAKLAKAGKSDRRLLWHGSRCTNFGGILSQGLRIAPPEAPVSGYMFGKGVYLADMSTKSANYCHAWQSGRTGLLLLCEAELGDPMWKLYGSSYNASQDAVSNGSISTWGLGRTAPLEWKDASCVNKALKGVKMPDTSNKLPGFVDDTKCGLMYNEFICYDVSQIRLRYLLRVRME